MTDPKLGRILENRYQLVELVGRGAMGRVYRAQHVLLRGTFAVKFLAQTLLNAPMRDRFFAEARVCALLGQKSIHIVRVIDYGVDEDEIPFYVMEYLDGRNLTDIINESPLTLPRFLNLTHQICLGLQCAHQGVPIDDAGDVRPIIHRDIKPRNIVVVQDNTLGELVKILDFGIATLLQGEGGNNPQANKFMGTLAYSSPEQMDSQELDGRSDIYSLGIVMFQMLTGKLPIHTPGRTFKDWYHAHKTQVPRSFQEVDPNLKLPKALESLIMDCLAKSPADRPQNIDAVIDALRPLLQRYGNGQEIGRRIGDALSRVPVVAESLVEKAATSDEASATETNGATPIDHAVKVVYSTSERLSAFEAFWRQLTWPSGMPIAQIVFSKNIETPKGRMATLWTMLSEDEINYLRNSSLYNHFYKNFLGIMSPHPTVLWITALYNRFRHQERGPRWFSCYLDLQSPTGQETVRLLTERGTYRLLFFSLEPPHTCLHAVKLKIHPYQCQLLQRWVLTGTTWKSIGNFNESKEILKQELEKLKPRVQTDLENASRLRE
ncbi:serine/threonine protein kinase [Trichothermofontia sichuanensis B231]|uniref:serine/threonine protein kinase n=1 Tax=Trichothermofontia sichuanensis TaxID=3045816 RepID=UPI0022476507|nr:serine/threonine-protein kinase [Trichothermofontia sichuanensis]UZQ55936.1 serine/threonine protein kinase [Trichothermofontia sichuanensis B231]